MDMLTLEERLKLLAELGEYIKTGMDEAADAVIQRAYHENKWFTPEFIRQSLDALANQMLDMEALSEWADHYQIKPMKAEPKHIGIVMAGNIPLVGFHDWLCVFVAGHYARVKLSEKDRLLLPFLVAKMGEWEKESWAYTHFTAEGETLKQVDAVIATGSNNSARLFESYFGKYPNIIRKNRNGVAVLMGDETEADFIQLGKDIFTYFGLGCRNVSKLYVPKNYDFKPLLEALHQYQDVIHHDKYKNNYDYNYTLYLLNQMPHHTSGCLLFREDESLNSRIASVHYSEYESLDGLKSELSNRSEEIQCLVGALDVPGVTTIPFGESQTPGLRDYADGVDVMDFLNKLN
ncbi:MAG: acyl-CoA reductase [Saprospiraceae bacterium]